MSQLKVIGAGLAGCEAAWQAAQCGVSVILYEMRPQKMTGAHRTGDVAELVCSNSLRSRELCTGAGLLKEELRRAGSLIMEAAHASAVPAGSAMAVDRELFSRFIDQKLAGHQNITIIREEVEKLPDTGVIIIASGPLTSGALAEEMRRLIGGEHLYFYDAIAPIVDAESIDFSIAFRASRYGKGDDDYINCPMNETEYDRFYNALVEADTIDAHAFEQAHFFEGCMPIEVMARRGRDTLCFGPMKPVGLIDPRSGRRPYAVVQLRAENLAKTAYNIVGFQTRLRQGEQKRVFSMIPGLHRAEFLRYGSIHRNTFINAPLYLNPDLTLKSHPAIFLAGQITGVEGYIESAAMGFLAGVHAARQLCSLPFLPVPAQSAHGALIRHLTESDPCHFQPSNIHFGLFTNTDMIPKIKDKKKRRIMIAETALTAWQSFVETLRKDCP